MDLNQECTVFSLLPLVLISLQICSLLKMLQKPVFQVTVLSYFLLRFLPRDVCINILFSRGNLSLQGSMPTKSLRIEKIFFPSLSLLVIQMGLPGLYYLT